MNDGSFPLFKGCTRPATFMGVPFAPFFIVNGLLLWLGVVTPWKPILVLTIPATFIMRAIAKEDEYRFRQWGLAILLFAPTFAQKRFWEGCISLLPANAKRTKKHAQWLLAPPEWLREKKRLEQLQAQESEAGRAIFAVPAQSTQDTPGGIASDEDDAVYAVPAVGVRTGARPIGGAAADMKAEEGVR